MNLVVTGATSFLGVALIKALLKTKHQVYAVVRPGSKNRGALDAVAAESGSEDAVNISQQERSGSGRGAAAVGGRLRVIELELEKLDTIEQMIPERCQVYFHFGWDGSGSENRKKADVQHKNALDGLKALEGARKLGCKRFLFSGSQAEYGVCQTVMDELRPCDPVSEYGKAKVEFYKLAVEQVRGWNQVETEGRPFEYVHTRIFSVYGPGDHLWSLVNTCLNRFQNDEIMELGACVQQWNFLYIEDLVKGLMALAFCEEPVGCTGETEENGIYNVAADADATMPLRQYVEKMHELCGNRGKCVYGKVPPNAEGQANLIPDIRKIKEKTGWKPEIGFEEGIKRMLEIECEKKWDMQEVKRVQKADCVQETGQVQGCEHRCIVCGSPLSGEPLMSLDGMPASAQDIPGAEDVDRDTGVTLHLHQCRNCGLVQFACQPVDYYRDVIRSGGYSTTMVNLRTSQYRHLIDTYGLQGKKFLEVGCGRGEFLKVLTGFPVEAYGVEHRQPLVEIAVADGLNVVPGFTEDVDTVLGEHGPYDVFLSFNFLEHQPHPGVMLDCIYRNLSEDGMGLVTVPSLEYILQYDGYYELIRDHIAYYTFDTLRYLLEHHGFQVLEEEMVNRDTLSVIVRKMPKDRCIASVHSCGESQKRQTDSFEKGIMIDISGLKASLVDIRQQMKRLTDELEAEHQSLAIWGASHQGFTLAATTCLGEKASYIIDSAPFKQGRFAPASHLPIVAPDYYLDHPVDVILIVAPGYTEEIAGVIRSRFGADVKILTLRSERIEELV